MKQFVGRFVSHGADFKRESRRQLRMLIIVTLGFTIAFSWRQTAFDLSEHLVQILTNVQNTSSLTILTSTFITIVSVIIIYLTSHFLKDDY